ncbi:transcriptional regulator, AbrB family [Thermaerobacter marianensis DSM 12885]|uniref:Transcriptional regulator, AbrB family n=1 Tax=Thermaerobacter marianensis (strain ATCC 700841 / DSM 12885 / JCM 10246 / 7p75a) TaxID=644966 RepID=E6SG66_THEM7|nr:AbrB/MazE/SpoVT family DNA-binding domain-containing protein [Thermaerobacter marianensis]ADU50483.1 transcriptional regulator, AbrB family [Thermaerobacter marianensis DSM 12885]
MGTRGDRAVAIVKILQRGQMTLPKAIRERVGLEEGDDVLVYVNGQGEIVLYPLPRPRSLKELGNVLKIDRPVSPAEARQAIREHRTRRWAEKDGLEAAGTQGLAQAAAGGEPAAERVRE